MLRASRVDPDFIEQSHLTASELLGEKISFCWNVISLLQQFSCDRYLWGAGNRISSSGWRAVESQDDSEGRSQEESCVWTWMATSLNWSTGSSRVESFCCCLFFFFLNLRQSA